MSATELLPATFPTDARAREWSRHLDADRYGIAEIVPSKTVPGRWQIRVRPISRKAAGHG